MFDLYDGDFYFPRIICSILEREGYEAYAVGGCVRDAIIGRTLSDVDITTNATPDRVKDIFENNGYRVIETGLKHGTVSILHKTDLYEITTMRTEGEYRDNRRPDSVSYVDDIRIDLSRRDFTVNALAYSFSTNEITDIFDGRKDIENKLIRCVGDPYARFGEDALRILRALRFSSKLGFDIESSTATAMRDLKHNIMYVSSERIYSELCGILCGQFAEKVICEYYDVLSVIIPELYACAGFDQHSKYHSYDVLTHTAKVVAHIPAKPYLRLSALFHDLGKPSVFSMSEEGEGHFYAHAKKSTDIAKRMLDELKADNQTKEKVLFLVSHHDTPLPNEEVALRKRLSRMGKENFFDLLLLARADCQAQSDLVAHRLFKYDETERMAKKMIEDEDCLSLASLQINGNSLIRLGMKPGKKIGEVLNLLLDEVLSGKIKNDTLSLEQEAASIISEGKLREE